MKKRIPAIFMAALMTALCCSAGLADNAEKDGDRGPITRYITGTYGGYSFLLDATASSCTLIKATGTYGTNANMKLKFDPTFGYYANNGSFVTLMGYNHNYIEYGTFYTNTLTKSYTVSQAGSELDLSGVLNSSFIFKSCVYKLNIGYTDVVPLNVTYVS